MFSITSISRTFAMKCVPSWPLFHELKNKACHHLLIVGQFRDRYIQVKVNEIEV